MTLNIVVVKSGGTTWSECIMSCYEAMISKSGRCNFFYIMAKICFIGWMDDYKTKTVYKTTDPGMVMIRVMFGHRVVIDKKTQTSSNPSIPSTGLSGKSSI